MIRKICSAYQKGVDDGFALEDYNNPFHNPDLYIAYYFGFKLGLKSRDDMCVAREPHTCVLIEPHEKEFLYSNAGAFHGK